MSLSESRFPLFRDMRYRQLAHPPGVTMIPPERGTWDLGSLDRGGTREDIGCACRCVVRVRRCRGCAGAAVVQDHYREGLRDQERHLRQRGSNREPGSLFGDAAEGEIGCGLLFL